MGASKTLLDKEARQTLKGVEKAKFILPLSKALLKAKVIEVALELSIFWTNSQHGNHKFFLCKYLLSMIWAHTSKCHLWMKDVHWEEAKEHEYQQLDQ